MGKFLCELCGDFLDSDFRGRMESFSEITLDVSVRLFDEKVSKRKDKFMNKVKKSSYTHKKKRYKLSKHKFRPHEVEMLSKRGEDLKSVYGAPDYEQPVLCTYCQEASDNAKRLVSEGWVPFVCLDCGVEGMLMGNTDLTKNIRSKMRKGNYDEILIQYTDCADHE